MEKAVSILLKSMTGYGRERRILHGREITVEMKAVNHRYFEYASRVPRSYSFLEDKLKALVQASVARGKVELSLAVNAIEAPETQVTVNLPLAQQYVDALRQANRQLGLTDDLSLSKLARFNDIFLCQAAQIDEAQLWEDVSQTAQATVDQFVQMRTCEGERLYSDILSRLTMMEEKITFIEERSPQVNENYRNRLFSRLSEVLGDRTIDEYRILQEAAIFADKTAVDEETVRLRSHVAQLRALMDAPGSVGKKLDFIVQEMNRETNTIGSKAQDIQIAAVIVEMKAEIEKIREQVQNIE